VLDLSLNQRSVRTINFINRENPISVLYSTYFHPQRNTFPPFPRPLWVAPAHPGRTGAALDSSSNAPPCIPGTRVPWYPYFSAARPRGRSGETSTKLNQRNSPIPSPSMFRYQVYSVLKLTGLPLFTFAQSFGVQPKD
jgi:hypothetical protein